MDDMVVNMIDVGEETGDLDTMLTKIADVYDEEVDVLVESLISLLEPIMVVVLGLHRRHHRHRPVHAAVVAHRKPGRRQEVTCSPLCLCASVVQILTTEAQRHRENKIRLLSRSPARPTHVGRNTISLSRRYAMIRPASRQGRTGFTLVEMLVVIAIIAVLAALITAGVQVVRTRTVDATNANDINQLKIALENFKTKFGVYPPSRVHLINSGTYNTALVAGTTTPQNPLDFESNRILSIMWPRLAYPVDWSGGTGGKNTDWILDGDQCLVFFLGGIPSASPAGVTGFSSSPTNPTAAVAQGGTRIPSFFAFQTNRLVQLPGHAANSAPFFSYIDAYGTPTKPSVYAYFSTLKQANQYNPYYSFPYGATIKAAPVSDCNTIGAMPYYAPPLNGVAQFQNANSFQIISGGADQTFGSTTTNQGVIWNSAGSGATFNLQVGGAAVPAPFGGMDDRTNFCANILSAGAGQ